MITACPCAAGCRTAAALDPAAEEARFVAANPDAYGNIKTVKAEFVFMMWV